jgi:phosphoglycerate kinase
MTLATDEKILLPSDLIVAEVGESAERSTLVTDIRANERAVDIGPVTALAWAKKITEASFVLWNGPMGIYEQGYVDATNVLAQALVTSHAKAVVGGGDTIAALKDQTFDPERIFISTGGGAMLQFLADGTLPAIEALK